jgi:hypothetical protein
MKVHEHKIVPNMKIVQIFITSALPHQNMIIQTYTPNPKHTTQV